jgi:hypothetical protein
VVVEVMPIVESVTEVLGESGTLVGVGVGGSTTAEPPVNSKTAANPRVTTNAKAMSATIGPSSRRGARGPSFTSFASLAACAVARACEADGGVRDGAERAGSAARRASKALSGGIIALFLSPVSPPRADLSDILDCRGQSALCPV